MKPMKMTPAFRYGSMTPWGGDGLRKLGKQIPDPCTGESLEVSVLPGLESRDERGKTLTEILETGGPEVRGTQVGETFPLLLKFISAADWLSVQVHPDDAYAGANEGGKLGKTEAWIILEAEEGAEIVYGTAPGVTREMLAKACQEGGEVLSACLRKVPVHAGEVYFIPAGMLHALGGGITVAEIQQSSDVTYRFYDWDRRDKNGQGRELHLRKGLDVVRPELQLPPCEGQVSESPAARLTRYIEEPAFTLSLLEVRDRFILPSQPERFRLLAALAPCTLETEGEKISLGRGECVFVPACAKAVILCGGKVLLMCPGRG